MSNNDLHKLAQKAEYDGDDDIALKIYKKIDDIQAKLYISILEDDDELYEKVVKNIGLGGLFKIADNDEEQDIGEMREVNINKKYTHLYFYHNEDTLCKMFQKITNFGADSEKSKELYYVSLAYSELSRIYEKRTDKMYTDAEVWDSDDNLIEEESESDSDEEESESDEESESKEEESESDEEESESESKEESD